MKEGINMINEIAVNLLEKVIKEKYEKIELDNKWWDDKDFYYEFKAEQKVSDKQFEEFEEKIRKLNNKCFVKLIRISGVYYEGNVENEMINRICGKAFTSEEDLNSYLAFVEEASLYDHRKIARDLDLFCFSDYVGPGLPLYTPRGVIVKDALQKEIEKVCRKYGFQKVSCPSLADISLFETSGHAMKFNDELFRVSSSKRS